MSDEEYAGVGAKILSTMGDAYASVDMMVKVINSVGIHVFTVPAHPSVRCGLP